MTHRSTARWTTLGLVVLTFACGGGGSSGSSKNNGDDFGVATGAIGGTVAAAGDMPISGVDVQVFFQGGDELEQFATRTNGVGRWRMEGLPVGAFEFEFTPPESDPPLTPLHYEEIVVNPGENVFQPVFLATILGELTLLSNVAFEQTDLTFSLLRDTDNGAEGILPTDDPLPGLSVTLPADTAILIGQDEVPSGEAVDLQLALVAPEQVPMAFVDEEDRSRASKVFFSIQPAEIRFVEPGTKIPRPLQVTYPNVNGLGLGTTVDLYRFDHDSFDWVQAGTGTVTYSGPGFADLVIVPDPGAGLPVTGWNAPPGPPPPLINVEGQLYENDAVQGNELALAGVVVVTNGGFFDVTDDEGRFRIPGVPLIEGFGATMICRAFSDAASTQEIATSEPFEPTFPTSTCDIVLTLQGSPLDTDPPSVTEADLDPPSGATNVAVDMPLTLPFSELLDENTLEGEIVVQGPGGAVTGQVVVQTVASGSAEGSLPFTQVVFLPDAPFPASSPFNVIVGTGIADLNGNTPDLPFLYGFETGSSSAGAPLVLAVDPQGGPAETPVEIMGVNLDGVTDVTFDGTSVPFTASPSTIGFDVPVLTSVGAGGKTVGLTFGAEGIDRTLDFRLEPRITSIDPSFSFGYFGGFVTLIGNNFSETGDNAVSFNSVAATEIYSFLNELIDVRPPQGSSSGAVVVTVDGDPELSSAPVFHTIVDFPDFSGPYFVSSSPDDLDVNVSVGTSVVVKFNELVTADSTLDVTYVPGGPGAEGEPVAVAGTTQVRIDEDGERGVIEFFPDDLPGETVVTVDAGDIRNLSGVQAELKKEGFPFSFMTGPKDLDTLGQAKENLQAGNLTSGRNLLQTVIDDVASTAAQVNEARVLILLVDLALVIDQEGTGAQASALHDLLAGFGFPSSGPDLVNLMAFSTSQPIPADSPDCAAVLAYLRDHLIPAIETLRLGLLALPADWTLQVTTQIGATTELDATDVLAAVAYLDAHLIGAHLFVAQSCNLDIDEAVNNPTTAQPNADVLDADPTLGAGLSLLDVQAAQQSVRDLGDSYDAALASLLAEVDDQADDFVVFTGMTAQEIADQQQVAADLAVELDTLAAATASAQTTTIEGKMFRGDLGRALENLVPRAAIPVLEDFKEFKRLAPLPVPGLTSIFDTVPAQTEEQLTARLDLLTTFDDAPVASIDLTDGVTSEWPGAALAFTDPSGPDDHDAHLDLPNHAVDITGIHVAQTKTVASPPPGTSNPDDLFFRIDFDAGTPFSPTGYDEYYFELTSNSQLLELPDLYGYFDDFNGDIDFYVFESDGFEYVVNWSTGDPGPVRAQAGPGFLEFSLPKEQLIELAGIPDGAEYVLDFKAVAYEFVPGQGYIAASDGHPPIRILMDLPQP